MWEKYKAEEQQIQAPEFLKEETIENMKAYQQTHFDSISTRRVPTHRLALVCVLLALSGFMLYFRLSSPRNSGDLDPPYDDLYDREEIHMERVNGSEVLEPDNGYYWICPIFSEDEGRNIIITPPN